MDLQEMASNVSYKDYHEDYLSNNNGTTAPEVFFAVAAIPPFALFSMLSYIISTNVNEFYRLSVKTFTIEFFSIVVPTIATFTVFSDYVFLILFSTLFLFCLIFLLLWRRCRKKHVPVKKVYNYVYQSKRCPHFTFIRALTNMITAVCILAVDFTIFPLHFAKTETYGFSVMDIGVGLFVALNAVVAPEARGVPNHSTVSKACVGSIPLLILGSVRLLATHMLDYHQHISEYGVHWNFFYTLACTKVLASTLLFTLRNLPSSVCFLMSVCIMVGYELSLLSGLKEWILGNEPRTDFLTSNREGIFSSFGYVAIYLGGVLLGRMFFKEQSFSLQKNVRLLATLVGLGSICWISTCLCASTIGVSRRLANMGYCIWVFTFTISTLCLALLAEIVSVLLYIPFGHGKKIKPLLPLMFEVINDHGLFFFLTANLLTGFVNLTIKTLFIGPVKSFIILTLYMMMCCGITCIYTLRNNKT